MTETATQQETKAEKFLRIGNKRLQRFQDICRNIGQLANNSYEYTPEQLENLKNILYKCVNDTVAKLEHQKAKKEYFQL